MMEITTREEYPHEVQADAVVMTVFSDEAPTGEMALLDEQMEGMISKLIASGEIGGKYREFTMLHTDKIRSPRVLIMGLGKKKEFDVDKIRSMVGRSARILRRINVNHIAYSSFTGLGIDPALAGQLIVEGGLLGLYRFKKYITGKTYEEPLKKLTILAKNRDELVNINLGIKKGKILADATMMARDLTNEPACFMTPRYFADKAMSVARELNLEHFIIDEGEMKRQGMGGILGVAQGSEEPPRIVIIHYKGNPGGPTLGLVGKGITFDSGGLSLKTPDSMARMHTDCAGACAVLGTVSAIARSGLNFNVIAVMAMAENMPSGKSYKVGDILKSFSGKTIEILNTDAEGRLLLADALFLAKKMGADFIVDIATLTGGCVTALGYTASGLFSNNEVLIRMLKKAGEMSAENMWHLPLYEDYLTMIRSDVADLENSGGRAASPCTAAKFLEQFVEDTPWAHLDIAGTSVIERERTPYLKKPYLPKEGATGVGVRTLFHLTELLSNEYVKSKSKEK